ncbi:MAG: CRISPR-associated endonuclease Cas2 [Synergistaceae bacterium]|jgi:CRISPR-associated protein Cas2|nr:CRISPR-associated endonuclease Cas2 [Synergistaceae bacterium]
MMVLITYDVSTESEGGKRRLRRVAKLCEDFGQRVQCSVFECLVNSAQWAGLKHRLEQEIDKEQDSLRFYSLGTNWKRNVEHLGVKKAYDPEGLILL